MSSAGSVSSFKNYYEVLRVRPYDEPELIRASFLAQMKRWHPDRYHNADAAMRRLATERAKLINEAREHLLDAVRKAEYDALFAARFPRRFEKLSTKARPESRRPTIDIDGVAVNPKSNFERNPYEVFQFKWMDFAVRIRPRTGSVVFNAAHFLERNPDCDVRFRFAHNLEWTVFSRKSIYAARYSGDVALVEMQARHVNASGRARYSKPMRKTIIITKYPAAMMQRTRILLQMRQSRNRMIFKLVAAIVGASLLPVDFVGKLLG